MLKYYVTLSVKTSTLFETVCSWYCWYLIVVYKRQGLVGPLSSQDVMRKYDPFLKLHKYVYIITRIYVYMYFLFESKAMNAKL